jgi:hypothetical protein
MDPISHFRSLDDLIRTLDRERKLLMALFQDRKRLSFRRDIARDLASRKDESLDYLRRFGVIRDNGDFVELEDMYMKFFEEVLEVNEEISVASVKESIDNLNAARNVAFKIIETFTEHQQLLRHIMVAEYKDEYGKKKEEAYMEDKLKHILARSSACI